MDNFLMMLENLALSQWVLGSIWGYPVFLTFHSLGLGLLVGLLVVIDLRVLGMAKPLPLSELRRLWIGFAFNAVSGVVLFMADARKDYYSNSFRWKILSIVIGLLIAVYLNKKVLREDTADTPPLAKALAVASLLSWTGAVVAGRLIAYLSSPV
jgi:general stress protein CsbA